MYEVLERLSGEKVPREYVSVIVLSVTVLDRNG